MDADAHEEPGMLRRWAQLYFNPSGRIGRREWWLHGILGSDRHSCHLRGPVDYARLCSCRTLGTWKYGQSPVVWVDSDCSVLPTLDRACVGVLRARSEANARHGTDPHGHFIGGIASRRRAGVALCRDIRDRGKVRGDLLDRHVVHLDGLAERRPERPNQYG